MKSFYRTKSNEYSIEEILYKIQSQIKSNHEEILLRMKSFSLSLQNLQKMISFKKPVQQNIPSEIDIGSTILKYQPTKFVKKQQNPLKIQQFRQQKFLKNCKILNQSLKQNLIEYFLKQKQQIHQTNLVYQFDNNKPITLELIENLPSILLIVQLKGSKKLIGAYTDICFKKRHIPQQNSKAFICDITNNKFFKPKNSFKTICFDPNYLIFGNSEIRIKFKDNMLFSNLGIAKCFFDCQSYPRKHFLGIDSDAQQAEIQTYQIYQLLTNK